MPRHHDGSSALEQAEFWSDVYEGRSVAIFNRGGRWPVYLDHTLQPNVVFATPDDAASWLIDRG